MHKNIIPGAVRDEFLDLWIYSSARHLQVFHENFADTILVSRLSLISTCNVLMFPASLPFGSTHTSLWLDFQSFSIWKPKEEKDQMFRMTLC